MHHLKLEELARLLDERPTETEADHLEECARCAAELEELKIQASLLAQLPDPVMPERVRMRVARMIDAELPLMAAGGKPERSWLRIAAGVMLFVIGSATGTFVIAPGLAGAAATSSAPVRTADAADAAASLAAAEAAYLQALANFARLNYSGDGLDPLNRLAALEGIVLTTRAALREAPADPVINNYHLTALGQRDELLRQIEVVDEADEWF